MIDDTDIKGVTPLPKTQAGVTSLKDAIAAEDKILSLEQIKPDYRFPEVASLEVYWHALRKDRLVPKRADVNPRGIENNLEFAFIAEEVAPGLARFRIAGMHLSELMAMDVRGMPLSSFFKATSRNQLRDALKAAFEKPQIVKLDLVSPGGFGAPKLEGKMILLPLADETGAITRILGALTTIGPVGREPRTFDIADANYTDIEGEISIETLPRRTVKTAVAQPFADSKPTRVPFLRILSFDS